MFVDLFQQIFDLCRLAFKEDHVEKLLKLAERSKLKFDKKLVAFRVVWVGYGFDQPGNE